jgi:hypothetical protein
MKKADQYISVMGWDLFILFVLFVEEKLTTPPSRTLNKINADVLTVKLASFARKQPFKSQKEVAFYIVIIL